MSMVSGSIMELSRKQKINGRISTEPYIVGADDVFPQLLWSRYFIVVQLYVVEYLEFHQDNISAMLMKRMVKSQARIKKSHLGAILLYKVSY